MNESLPDFSKIESSVSENKTLNVPLTDTHNNYLIDTVDCSLFQKGDLKPKKCIVKILLYR